jgi:DNA-binding transcriptional LysR family regulator
VRADLPTRLARNVVIPRLPQFLAEHSQLEIELSTTDRRVDLVHEGFDCVVRVGALPESDLVARRLGPVNNSDAYEAACLAGLGLVQAPALGVRPLIEDGSLVEVLPSFVSAPMPVSLLYANRRHQPKRVQALMAW